jgi:hypothetical protein
MCIGFTLQGIQYAELVALQGGARSEYLDFFFFVCGFSQYLQSYSGIVVLLQIRILPFCSKSFPVYYSQSFFLSLDAIQSEHSGDN